MVACHQQESKPPPRDTPPAPAAPEPAPEKVSSDPGDASSYVGMSVHEASSRADKAGIRWRIVEEDGQSRPVTKDFRPDRLNFAVTAGKIIRVTKG